MNDEIAAKMKKAWKAVRRAFVEEPLIFMDDRGNYWLNNYAKDFISLRKIPVDDLMEWLRIGSSHLQNLSYEDISILMMQLPGNNVAALLRVSDPDMGVKKTFLTSKEREVLRLLVKGNSNKEIAGYMKISPGTVNAHLDKIYMKLDCTNRVAACFLALKNGLFLPAGGRLTKDNET